MVARILRIILLLEFFGWTLLAALVVSCLDWGLAAAMLMVAAGVVGVRVGAVAVTFLFSVAHGIEPPPALRIDIRGGIVVFCKEVLAYTMLFSVVQPFVDRWLGADRLDEAGNGRIPVLLVHGYACNRGCWAYLARALHRAGWPVATMNLEPPFDSIDSFAGQIGRRVDAVLRQTGAEQVVLVAHSMGGLAVRRYLAMHGEAAVKAVVTLGTPHAGTELARLGLGRCARDMEPGSAFLRALPDTLAIPLVSIYSAHDNFVMPQGPCTVQGARNVAFAGVGHLQMLGSHAVATALLRELAGVA